MNQIISDVFVEHYGNFQALVILTTSSVYLRFLLEFFGQAWVRTKAHTATLVFLPLIVYVITTVISGNIALSLGMVGALSIIRFRNPVRSPIELSSYFCAIALGISAAVSVMWAIYLILAISFGVLVLGLINYISAKISGYQFFITSFSEGNSLSTLTVVFRKNISFLDELTELTSKFVSEGAVTYTFSSGNFSYLLELEKDLRTNEDIITLEIRR